MNKINFCRRNLAHYEELQVKLFGRVRDSCKESDAEELSDSELDPVEPIASPPPAQVQPTFSPTRVQVSSSLVADPTIDSLIKSVFKMDVNNTHFGTVSHEEAITANLKQGFRNRGLKIFSTPNVVVGTTPSISTTTITILLSNVDARWFGKDVENFIPYKMTQTAQNSIVFESPVADYDFFFSPRMNEENAFDDIDLKDAFVVSDEDAEQVEFEIMRNQLIDEDNRNEAWHQRIKIDFPGKRLDYSIINPNRRNGEIPMEFVFAPLPVVKWRVAIVPDTQRVVRPKEKESNSAHDLYQKYLRERDAVINSPTGS